jgi:flavin reductase (DIM6/NTAB) family NADH-FMN oxidoreductase RutF/DNA-binding GntR family transcriptional regulator
VSVSDEKALEPSYADGTPEPLGAEGFRAVMSQFASGVTVVTTRYDGVDFGTTASAFTSLSLEPPMALVCLFRGAVTERTIVETGCFGINILREGQGQLAEVFASKRDDRFEGLDYSYGELGVPLLNGALAHIECRVSEQVLGGTHTVFLGRAVRAAAHDGQPLAYFRGSFGHFLVGTDAVVHRALRQDIVSGRHPAGAALDVAELAAEYEAEPAAVHSVIQHLVNGGHVVRRPDGSYQVWKPDLPAVLEMIGARRAIEAGAAATAIEWIEPEKLERWMALAGEPCSACPGGVDAGRADFHAQLVEFSGNRRLCDQYGELSLAQIAANYSLDPIAAGDCAGDHRAIAEAYRERNLPGVIAGIERHSRRLRGLWSRILDS